MGFSDQGEVNLETVIAKKPDLMIAQLRAKPALKQTGVLTQLRVMSGSKRGGKTSLVIPLGYNTDVREIKPASIICVTVPE